MINDYSKLKNISIIIYPKDYVWKFMSYLLYFINCVLRSRSVLYDLGVVLVSF